MSSLAIRRSRFPDRAFLMALALLEVVLVVLTQTLAWAGVFFFLLVPVAAALVLSSRRDAVTILGVFLVLLLFIPSRFAISLFSQALTPALLVGLFALWLWACLLIVPGLGLGAGPQPLRIVIFFFLWSAAISWALAFLRPLPVVEQRQALIGYLSLAGAGGIVLLAADGIRSRARLDDLMRLLALGASLVALVAIVQFVTGIDISRYLHPPGLETTGAGAAFIDARSTLRRVQGTTEHPIELAVLLTAVLPIALHLARNHTGPSRWGRRLWWVCSCLLLAAVPLTVSRAGVVGLAVGTVALMALWRGRDRLLLLITLALMTAAMRLAIPGLIGTLISLFTNADTDPSITHRTNDYAAAAPYIQDAPWFGRGFHTFIHSYYFVIDNQYLSTLIETGAMGLVALVGVLLTGVALALLARRLSHDPVDRDLAHALAAAILVAGVGFFSFDALSFPVATGVAFLLVGCAGALWRLQRQVTAERPVEALRAALMP